MRFEIQSIWQICIHIALLNSRNKGTKDKHEIQQQQQISGWRERYNNKALVNLFHFIFVVDHISVDIETGFTNIIIA